LEEPVFRDPARTFRLIAVAEACSWLGLLIGMLFKYSLAHNPVGVKVFGPIHGAMFIAYLVTLLWLARRERWGLARLLIGAAAAVPPFTSVLFERWVARRRADAVAGTPAREPAGEPAGTVTR
jgi:integral membrane protein